MTVKRPVRSIYYPCKWTNRINNSLWWSTTVGEPKVIRGLFAKRLDRSDKIVYLIFCLDVFYTVQLDSSRMNFGINLIYSVNVSMRFIRKRRSIFNCSKKRLRTDVSYLHIIICSYDEWPNRTFIDVQLLVIDTFVRLNTQKWSFKSSLK